jgi:peroxiredoxin
MADTIASAEPTTASVQGRLDALQAERDATWTAEQLVAHAALRQSLEDEAGRRRLVRQGDVVAPFELPEVDGGTVVLDELLATGPVVLIFFRFEGCPACNAAWSAYRESLSPALRELGAHLVAVSPQVPERLVAIKRRLDADFLIAADPEATLIHRFGIGFAPAEEEREQLRAEGKDIGAILGTESWDLPYPTAVVVGQDRVVRFADVHPNWMVRTESSTIIDVVTALLAEDPA